MEFHELMSVEYDEEFGIVMKEWLEPNKDTGMVITTFSQLRLLKAVGDSIPDNFIIWFDDPGLDDVANINPMEEQEDSMGFSDPNNPKTHEVPKSFKWGTGREKSVVTLEELKNRLEETHGYSPADVTETIEQIEELKEDSTKEKPCKTREIQGVFYDIRPENLSLGNSTIKHRMVFTTTELLTKRALTKHLCNLWKPPIVHEMMEKVPYGRITVIGTNKVRRSHDAIIPIILRTLEKKNNPVQLIADGLGSVYNHINSKGVNVLTDTDILVEVSIPHPVEVKKVCAVLGLEYTTNQREITLQLMLDKIHQAIGRNSGYRWKDKECVVLVDKSYHADIIKAIRYNIDPKNSVVIDKTQKMSSKEKRIKPSASLLTKNMEENLNSVNRLIEDRRTITHAIDHVIKYIEDGEKRIHYIARLLTALTTFSKINLEIPTDDKKPENRTVTNYRFIWDHILTKWVNESNQDRIMTSYQSNMKKPV
jgi:hypothetical protein